MNCKCNSTGSSVLLRRWLACVADAVLILPSIVCAQTVEFTPDRWDLKDAEVKEYFGRQALAGTAWLKDTVFENGVIEVDLATDRQRSYPAIIFRRQADGEYEHVYLRPHRAGLYPDAVQYAPVFNGVAGWQLYNGPGFTADVTLPENQWVHVRIEVKGVQARVFVGDTARPVLVVNELKRGTGKGALGLQGPRKGSVHFSNFSFSTNDSFQFDPTPAPDPVPGIITEWSLSSARRVNVISAERFLDGQQPEKINWQSVTAEAGGLVDIARYCKPVAGETSKIWARATVTSDRKEFRPFAFGYSDDVSIYLNGQIVFQGISGYQSRDPSFLGIIGWNDIVYLPLEKGTNDLVLSVTETFGGWGFTVRDMNAIYRHPLLQETWEINGQLNAPESVAWDAARRVLYVSCVGDGTIARIAPDGVVTARQWVTGLKRPTGLKLRAGRLYSVERGGIAVIDPDHGEIVDRWAIPGAVFLNDLDFAPDGSLYVTDTLKDCVYRLRDGKPEVWIEGNAVRCPNGVLAETHRILVGLSEDGTIQAVDVGTRMVTTLFTLGPGANMDGLVGDGKGGYLFSDYFGRIYRGDAKGGTVLLLDRKGPRQFTADFVHIPEKGLLIVPSLYDNRLTAYAIKPEAP
jgi:sugar lactone lactonase YvrE